MSSLEVPSSGGRSRFGARSPEAKASSPGRSRFKGAISQVLDEEKATSVFAGMGARRVRVLSSLADCCRLSLQQLLPECSLRAPPTNNNCSLRSAKSRWLNALYHHLNPLNCNFIFIDGWFDLSLFLSLTLIQHTLRLAYSHGLPATKEKPPIPRGTSAELHPFI